MFDAMCSALGLVALMPLMMLVAAAVRLEDGGPVFFFQERIGRFKRPFRLIKFRSMTVNAAEVGPELTVAGDARITSVGRFIRRTKLHELPQLYNVLRGEMSLVGPRPEVPRYVEMFGGEYEKILSIRPGITDYASIAFRNEEEILRKAPDPEQKYVTEVLPRKLELNLAYIGKAGVLEDIRVILRTIHVVFLR